MISLVLALQVVQLGLALWVLSLSRKGDGLTKRMRRRTEYAGQAARYAVGHTEDLHQRQEVGLEVFKALDAADNKRRDYTDKEARLAVNAALIELKGGK